MYYTSHSVKLYQSRSEAGDDALLSGNQWSPPQSSVGQPFMPQHYTCKLNCTNSPFNTRERHFICIRRLTQSQIAYRVRSTVLRIVKLHNGVITSATLAVIRTGRGQSYHALEPTALIWSAAHYVIYCSTWSVVKLLNYQHPDLPYP